MNMHGCVPTRSGHQPNTKPREPPPATQSNASSLELLLALLALIPETTISWVVDSTLLSREHAEPRVQETNCRGRHARRRPCDGSVHDVVQQGRATPRRWPTGRRLRDRGIEHRRTR